MAYLLPTGICLTNGIASTWRLNCPLVAHLAGAFENATLVYLLEDESIACLPTASLLEFHTPFFASCLWFWGILLTPLCQWEHYWSAPQAGHRPQLTEKNTSNKASEPRIRQHWNTSKPVYFSFQVMFYFLISFLVLNYWVSKKLKHCRKETTFQLKLHSN